MPEIDKLSDEKYQELKNLIKLYLTLIVIGWSFFLMLRIPTPTNMPMDKTILDIVQFYIQSIIANPNVMQLYMLFLLLYTGFVVMETLVLLRACAMSLYSKYKNNNAIH